jgi:hypothetical protein
MNNYQKNPSLFFVLRIFIMPSPLPNHAHNSSSSLAIILSLVPRQWSLSRDYLASLAVWPFVFSVTVELLSQLHEVLSVSYRRSLRRISLQNLPTWTSTRCKFPPRDHWLWPLANQEGASRLHTSDILLRVTLTLPTPDLRSGA